MLVVQTVDGMGRLEDGLARNALDDRLLDVRGGLARREAIRKRFDLLDGSLRTAVIRTYIFD